MEIEIDPSVDWEDESINEQIHPSRLEDFDVLNVSERYKILTNLANLADNPTWAVDFDELSLLLLDVGLLLSQTQEKLGRNPTILEDPLNRGDALGNVLMIRKQNSGKDHELLSKIGLALQDIVHQARDIHKSQDHWDEDTSQLTFDLGEFDDAESVSLLKAKKKLAFVRKQNFQLDRKNSRLVRQLDQQKKQLAKLRNLIPEKDRKVFVEKSYSFSTRSPHKNSLALPEEGEITVQPLTPTPLTKPDANDLGSNISCLDSMSSSSERSRNSSRRQGHKESQLDCLEW